MPAHASGYNQQKASMGKEEEEGAMVRKEKRTAVGGGRGEGRREASKREDGGLHES